MQVPFPLLQLLRLEQSKSKQPGPARPVLQLQILGP